MPRSKQRRIDEVGNLKNVFPNPYYMEGNWHKEYFKNNNPITLELGCGAGEYTLELARQFPERNFIGIDKKGDRIWRGAKKAIDENLENVAFCRILIEKLNQFFAQNEVNEIWITFPDPQPKPSKANKRLSSTRFLEIYKDIISPNGLIHLKTDHKNLFEFSIETLKERKHKRLELIRDVHSQDAAPEYLQIKTFYEKKFMAKGIPINYLKFQLNQKD